MTVSVIMPCFNHGRFVVESIMSVVQQTHEPTELIIVDDCSSDDSFDRISAMALRDPRIKIIRHERNQGASSSRNDGLRAAQGEFIAFCDADDLWMPDKLAVQLRVLSENPESDVVYSDAIIINENNISSGRFFSEIFPPPRQSSGKLFNALCLGNFVNMQTVLFRRKCLDHGSLFDREIKWVEDWLCWARLSVWHHFIYIPRPLAKYRVHSQSTGFTQKRGGQINAFKGFRRVRKFSSEIAPSIDAQIYYRMGICLNRIGWNNSARRAYCRAIQVSLSSGQSLTQIIRPLIRFFIGAKSADQIRRL